MTRRILTRLGLVAFLIVATGLPARAGTTNVNSLSGVNFGFTATEAVVGGLSEIDFKFTSTNVVSAINGSNVSGVTATFPDLFLLPGTVSPVTPPPNVGFKPAANTTQYAVTNFGQVVFDYSIAEGTTNGNNLSLVGTVFIDPSSPATSATVGGTTYDFSAFLTPAPFFFTFSASLGDIIATLNAGAGSFTGSASFSQNIVPEPASLTLLGVTGVVTLALRRRRKA